jgi:hypothetical protein
VLVITNQISPQTESLQASPTEALKPEAVKDGALGAFARLLSGLLKGTGTKTTHSNEAGTDSLSIEETAKGVQKKGKISFGEENEVPAGLGADVKTAQKAENPDKIYFPKDLFKLSSEETPEIQDENLIAKDDFTLKDVFSGDKAENSDAEDQEIFPDFVNGIQTGNSGENLISGSGFDAEIDFRQSGKDGKPALPGEFRSPAGVPEFPEGPRNSPPQLTGFTRTGKTEAERDGKGDRLSEVRSRDKKRGAFNVSVQDFRSRAETASGTAPVPRGSGELRPRTGGESSMDVFIRANGKGGEPLQNGGKDMSPGEPVFETLLAQRLEQSLNGDIVQRAHMVLREGNEGTIRLALRPESLGNVKIRLELAENKITGHIFVESKEAFTAFEREIYSLERAFKDSGFDGASLDMSMASGNGDTEGQWRGEGPFFSERQSVDLAVSRYDAAPERRYLNRTDESGGGFSPRNGRISVNMLV